MMRCFLPLALTSLVVAASSARAHPSSPISLHFEERAEHTYLLAYRRSARADSVVSFTLPSDCVRSQPREAHEAFDMLRSELEVRCARSLEGRTLRVDGLGVVGVGALVSAAFRSGHVARGVLSADETALVIEPATAAQRVFADYLSLGVVHLLTGLDHLLFVLGLCFVVSGLRRLVLVLSAFTLGHSVTLSLAALDVVHLPSAPVELGIAASLIVVALEVFTPKEHVGVDRTFAMASSFGLLHGLGFAGALRETGLPAHAIPLSLFSFNLGVELAQLGVVLALLPLLAVVRRGSPRMQHIARASVGYTIGACAAMWCIERARAFF